jgi:hypothetical protein
MVWWRRLKEKVGWVSVGRREDCLKGRTAGDVPEMLNEISSSSLSPLRSRVLYTRTLGEMHPRVCVRMCVCVCVGRFFLDSHSTSLHHVLFFLSLFVRAVCVFLLRVRQRLETCAGCTMHPPTSTILLHTHSTSRRFRIYRLISSDQLANGISP